MPLVNRRSRLFAALVAIVGLLFAQMAISAFSCPQMGGNAAVAESGCDEAMVVNANLCEQHCEYGQASFESAKSPASPPALAGPFLRVHALVAEQPRGQAIESRHSPAGPAPPLIRFTVLRI